MKRALLSTVLALGMLLSLGLSVMANNATITNGQKEVHSDVYAHSIYDVVWHTIVPEDGEGDVTLPDGTNIRAEDIVDDRYRLIIYPIPESDTPAMEWIRNVIGDNADNIYPYLIYLVNDKGDILPATDIAITITMAADIPDPSVHSISHDGKLTRLDGDSNRNVVSFVTDGNPYYIIGEFYEVTEDTTDETTDGPVTPPQTGDGLVLMIFLFALAAVAIIVSTRRKETTAE
ncbi:MAG: hypothetical protein IJD10_01440 [Clostridia bacterium]|nr:hypothetical protein [Clostridia bacterium]